MKIGIGERNAQWRVAKGFDLLPSLFFQWGNGYINNFDTGRVQRHFELDIIFNFLFFTSFVEFYLMWGDEGEIE